MVSEEQVGKAFVEGRLGAEQIADLKRFVVESGILEKTNDSVVLDAPSEEVGIRTRSGVLRRAHSPDQASKECITSIKKYLLSLSIKSATSVAPEPYEAYPDDWYK